MKSIHIIAIIFISFIAGMFGGAFSERVFANPKADEKIPDQILARGFYLVDENNKPRAGISFDRSGQPAVYVLDKIGQMRGYLACEDSGPALALNDKKGNMSVGMRTGDRGDSIIALMAEKDRIRLALDYRPGRGPAILLSNEENAPKAFMAVNGGKPAIGIYQAQKKPAITMLWGPKRGALLGFWNSKNESKVAMGLQNDKPILFAYNPDDTGLLFNTQHDGRPALGLLSDGRVVWSATGASPQMPAMDGILDQILR